MKQTRKLSITLAWIVLLFLSFFLFVSSGVAKTVPKGKVVVAIDTNISTLDPHMHSQTVNTYVNYAICDDLFIKDPKTMEIRPNLAESWKNINDTTWEFKLRKGVKFHNGDPFNANCVKYSIERVLDPKQKSPQRGNMATITRLEVLDEYTVRIITTKPDPVLLHKLSRFQMINPLYVTKVGDAHYSNHPMGTGPYKFVEWVKGDRVVLEANENYWKFTPAVKTVIFRMIPETATQIAELLSGGVDIIKPVPPDQIPVIEKSGKAYISKSPILRVAFVVLDANGYGGPTPLQNIKVRQALNHAVNVDLIIKHILKGLALRTATGLNPIAFGFDKTIKPYDYDPEKAKQLLKEAGYPNGFTMNFYSHSGSLASVFQVVEVISGDFAKIGVKVKYNHYEDLGQELEAIAAKKLKDGFLHSWSSYNVPDADMLYYHWFREGQRNCYASDKKMNELLDAGRSTLDMEKRKKIYAEFQKHIVENAYWIPLYAQYLVLGVSNRINYEAPADETIKVAQITWKE